MFQALIFITIILLAMMGNLLVIVSVLRTKTLRRQKAYYFVVSLAVAGQICSILIDGKRVKCNFHSTGCLKFFLTIFYLISWHEKLPSHPLK